MMHLDLALFNAIHRLWGRNRFVDAVGTFIANVLTYFMVVGMVAFIFCIAPSNRERLFVLGEMLLAFLISRFLVTGILAILIRRPRPFVVLRFKPPFIPVTAGAFPSGHVSALFALAFVMLTFSVPWGAAYLMLSLLVGVARIFVGVHWPSDILAGVIVGLGSAFALDQYAKHAGRFTGISLGEEV